MLLSAGLGTRLRPLTLERAKPAIPVCGKPLIFRTIERLKSYGISSFRLNLSWLPNTVIEALMPSVKGKLDVSFSIEPEILGTGGGLKDNQDFFDSGTFVMVNADILFDFEIEQAITFHKKNKALATLVLLPQKPPFRFTPMRIDHKSNIINFYDGPPAYEPTPETYVFSGIHIIEPEVFNYIEPGIFQEIISHAYKRALKDGRRVLGYGITGYWNDLGSPSGYLQAVQAFLSGELGLAPRDSFVSENTKIHSSATISNVSIESGNILERNSTVMKSILWEDSVISQDSVVDNCIVGSGVRVTGSHQYEVITRNGSRPIVTD